jgi:predicted nucleic acid-binding protein
MNAKPFLDTNILIYAFALNDPRSEQAESLLAAGGVISMQVLNEFVNVSRRKLAREWLEIEDALSILRTILDPPIPLTIEVHEGAIGLSRDHGFAFYDSLIVSAAIRGGCQILYTEDMQDGQTVQGVTFRNPFPSIGG